MSKSKREITDPMLGRQSPDSLFWRKSLRSPTTLNISTQSRGGLTDSMGSLRRSGSASNLRKSTGNLAASFNNSMSGKNKTNSPELERIETEYIKNLQQQVYFLELEANFLCEQARKASEMHPMMTSEAERMLHKLRVMQSEMEGFQVEMRRKDSTIDLITQDKEKLVGKIKADEELHQREKRLLLDEVVQTKKEKDLLERDNKRKDHQIAQSRDEVQRSYESLRGAENKFQLLRNQLDVKSDEQRLTQQALEEKRTELLQTETKLRETEEKYFSSAHSIHDKLSEDLREEIRTLRLKLKEAEMAAEQDRFLRNKLSDDSAHLVKENALLNQQIIELTKKIDRERDLREGQDSRRSQNITELVVLKDREKQLQLELAQSREMLRKEQLRCKDLIDQLSKQGQVASATELHASTARSRLAELEGMHEKADAENSQLRRDKMLLVDHVADLQRQMDEKDTELSTLQSQLAMYSSEVRDKELENSLQSQRWEEFSRLADSMKSLSRSMAVRSSTNSPRLLTSSQLLN